MGLLVRFCQLTGILFEVPLGLLEVPAPFPKPDSASARAAAIAAVTGSTVGTALIRLFNFESKSAIARSEERRVGKEC